MIHRFDLNDLYNTAFGYRGIPYPFVPVDKGVKEVDDPDIEKIEKTTYTDGLIYTHTPLGTPLYMPCGFNVDGSIIQLPNEPIVSVTNKKRIVSTPLAGNTRRGTVKEIINTGDYKIKIQGLCINFKDDTYPEKEVSDLKQLFGLNRSIIIVNHLLNNILEIENVVIEEFRLPAMVGRPYSQAYELELISDEEFELIAE